jgi:protein-tyrosine phosphatase
MLTDGLLALGSVIAHVAQPNAVPFLVCCGAGRDRTGIVVACLLDLLGVPDEAIASDYAESDFFDQQGGRAHADTILELLKLIRSRHGTTARMLSPFDDVGDAVERLRRELLVPQRGEPS